MVSINRLENMEASVSLLA